MSFLYNIILFLIACFTNYIFNYRQPTTVSFRFTEQGERVRVSDRTGRIIPKPPWERRDWKQRSAIKGVQIMFDYVFKLNA